MKLLSLLIISLVVLPVFTGLPDSENKFHIIKGASDCTFLQTLEIGLYTEQDLAEEIEVKARAVGGNLAVYDKSKATGFLWDAVDGSSGIDTVLSIKVFNCE